jgi:PhnB protein
VADERDERALQAIEAALEQCPTAEFRSRLRKDLQRSIPMTEAATRAQGARPGYTAVTPFVNTPAAGELIAFAKHVFGAVETERTTLRAGGIHADLRIGDSMVMFHGGRDAKGPDGAPLPTQLVSFHIFVDDVDATYQRALDAGAESMGVPEDRPYGERSGFVKDVAGNHWYISKILPPGPTPDHTFSPHVYVHRTKERGADDFIDFLTRAFGARLEARHAFPNGLVGHAIVTIEGAPIEFGESDEPLRTEPAAFYLYVPDADALYRQALAAGAMSVYSVEDQPWGDRVGGVRDPWGNEWFIATHRGSNAS